MWFIFALITMIVWGIGDVFYKLGAEVQEKYSHLKTGMMVGLVMGLHAIFMLLTTDMNYDPVNLLIYLPVSFFYILSMVIGYYGLRYLQVSITSPIENSSGAITALLCLVFLHKSLDWLSGSGIVLICAGIFALSMIEKRKETQNITKEDKKYRTGFVAIIFPILYCIFDAIGTFLDAYYLDDVEKTPLVNVTEETFENVANTSYELTFLIAAILIIIYLLRKGESIRPADERKRGLAAVAETFGQFTYVYAMSGNGVVAAPMVSAYCIVTLIISRIFLKEKLSKPQSIAIAIVVLGIIFMGISEGLEG